MVGKGAKLNRDINTECIGDIIPPSVIAQRQVTCKKVIQNGLPQR